MGIDRTYAMPEIGTITCAVCNKPVDSWEFWEDPRDMTQKLRVHCHGDRDTMSVSMLDIARDGPALRDAVARGGTAFTTKRIEP